MKLRRMFLLLFTVFAIVPVIFSSVFLLTGTRKHSNRMAKDLLLTVAQQERRLLEDVFSQYLNDAAQFALSPALRTAAQQLGEDPLTDTPDTRAAQRLLEQWSERLPHVQQLMLCGLDYSVLQSNNSALPGLQCKLTAMHEKKLAEGTAIVTALQASQDSEEGKSFWVATPVWGEQPSDAVGYLMVQVDARRFDSVQTALGNTDSAFIALMDSTGTTVITNSETPFRSLSDLYERSNLSHALVSDALFPFYLQGEAYQGYYVKIESAGWRLFCAVQPAEFSMNAGEIVLVLGATLCLVGLLCLLLYQIITRLFSCPMQVLSQHILEIDAGNYSTRVPHLGNSEFGEIGEAFNKMLARIRKDRSELSLKEERHRIINEQSNSIIFEYNVETGQMTTSPGGRMLACFPQCMERFPEAAVELGTVDEAHAEALEELFGAMVRGQKSGALELRLRTYKNEQRWFSLALSTISDAQSHKPLRVVGKLTDIDEEKREAEQLVFKAARDPLTQLYNKETTQVKINERLATHSGENYHALLVVDVDHFKRVNDSYGHQKGDLVLQQIACVMQKQFRPLDIVGRMGGDEFMILLCDMPDAAAVRRKVQQMLDGVHKIVLCEETDDRISISAGIALFPQDGTGYSQLYAHADNAAYAAKSGGRNTMRFYREEME